jgi:NAD(P)-dependent dehydrogenase (short-subunit alcohol dehydrogenase family)
MSSIVTRLSGTTAAPDPAEFGIVHSAFVDVTFAGQVVLVTGGCRGIGRGIAQRFADEGARVAICCRHEPDDLPEGWLFVAADIREADQVDAVVTHTVDRFGRLDVLVNNAGGAPPADSATSSPRFTAGIIALNLTAAIVCAQRANAVMQQQESGGSIVNIASVSGVRPAPTALAYGAAKAGLLNATKTMAMEFAPRVRVNAAVVGLVVTEQAHLFYGDDEGIASVGATVPLGRMADPTDIADVCLFLASPLARYVSGAEILVHGGGEPPPFLEAAKNTGTR